MNGYLYLVSPDGQSGAWVHPLDLTTGNYPQYRSWIDATGMGDAEFESLIVRLQRGV